MPHSVLPRPANAKILRKSREQMQLCTHSRRGFELNRLHVHSNRELDDCSLNCMDSARLKLHQLCAQKRSHGVNIICPLGTTPTPAGQGEGRAFSDCSSTCDNLNKSVICRGGLVDHCLRMARGKLSHFIAICLLLLDMFICETESDQ